MAHWGSGTQRDGFAAGWERALAAITWLCVVATAAAIVAGLLEFAVLRRRRPFTACHGLHAAAWQLLVSIAVFVVSAVALRFGGLSRPDLGHAVTTVTTLVVAPGDFPSYWHAAAGGTRVLLVVLIGLLLINLGMGIFGAVAALRGKVFRAPLLGRLCAPPR